MHQNEIQSYKRIYVILLWKITFKSCFNQKLLNYFLFNNNSYYILNQSPITKNKYYTLVYVDLNLT